MILRNKKGERNMVKVIFIQDVWYPLQGVMNLSASLKEAGHQTDVAVGTDEEIFSEMRKFKPDIVAMSSMTAYRGFMLRMTKAIKDKKWPCVTVVGGFDSSFFPEIIEEVKHIDVLCRGEGNDAMVQLANAIKKGENYSKLNNLWVRQDNKIHKNPLAPFVNMNDKSFDDHEIYRKYKYFRDIEFVQIMAGRGCPYRCAYCFNHKYQEMYLPVSRRYASLRNPEIVIAEIKELKDKYNYKTVFFNDSTLGYNKKWLIEFCKMYKESGIDLPFTMNMCANEINQEVAEALGSTGKCYLIRMGLEAGNETFRKKVIRKNVTDKQLEDATNNLAKVGIPVSFQFMLGLPAETFEMALHTLNLSKKLSRKGTIRAPNIFKPFPKLDLADFGVLVGSYTRESIGSGSTIGDKTDAFDSCFRTDSDGRKINRLAQLCHIYMNFPVLRPLIKNVLVKLPDNIIYRKIWLYSDLFFTSRHHINASFTYLFKYVTQHLFKSAR